MIAARYILANDSAFTTALGSGKIFYGDAEQTTSLPYCVISLEGVTFNHTKDANENVDYEDVQISYFASSIKQTRDLAKLGKAALDRYSGQITVDTDSGESQTVIDCSIQAESFYPAMIENRDIYTYEQTYQMIIEKMKVICIKNHKDPRERRKGSFQKGRTYWITGELLDTLLKKKVVKELTNLKLK